MTEKITRRQFQETTGLDDWRVLAIGASAHFRTESFTQGVSLVEAIGRLAHAMEHHPDVDLRDQGVTVRVMTPEIKGLSLCDVELARAISAAARDLGANADPSAVQDVGLAIDALVSADVMPFWCAVLGYEMTDEDVLDPHRRWLGIWFQDMDAPRPQRNRIHVDIFVPHDQAEARVAAAVAAGGRVVYDAGAPTWWTLADPEGNEADIATWQGRD